MPTPRRPKEDVEAAMNNFIETTHYYAPGSDMTELWEPAPGELPPDPDPDDEDN